MTDQHFDPLFERRLEGWLRDLANEAVRPFDAVAIAHAAAERGSRPRFAFPTLPFAWRAVLALALLTTALVGVGIVGGFIRLPNNDLLPNPSFEPFSPLPSASGTPLAATPGPNETPPVNPPTTIPASVPPSFGATPTASPSAAPTAELSPTLEPTPSPTPSPTPTTEPSPTSTPSIEPTPTIAPVTAVDAVAIGNSHACTLADDGRIFCWGDNEYGELGDGTNDYRGLPTQPVVGITNGRAIAAGIRFSCAALFDGSVWCWGEDPGSDGQSNVPVQVPGISDATSVTAGGAFACALRANRHVACWGNGQAGQLGNGVYENNSGVPTAQPVVGIDNAVAVTAGWGHACALLADRTVECWGANGDGASVYGSLGDGTSELRRATPAPVVGLDQVREVRGGGWSVCATRIDASVWCWGYGEKGTLGDGSMSNSSVPLQVSGIDNSQVLAVGDYTACVTRADDSVWCWGDTSWASADGGPAATPVEGNKPSTLVVSAFDYGRYGVLIDNHGQAWLWGSGTNQTPQRWPVGP